MTGSEIVNQLLSKSGILRLAILVEIYTNWTSLYAPNMPRPTFRELHATELKDIPALIERPKALRGLILKLGCKKFAPKGFVDANKADEELDRLRRPFSGVQILMHVSVEFLLCILLSVLLTPLGGLIYILYWIDKRRDYGWLPPRTYKILTKLTNNVKLNLLKWDQHSLMQLASVVEEMPNLDGKSAPVSSNNESVTEPLPESGPAPESPVDSVGPSPAAIENTHGDKSQSDNSLPDSTKPTTNVPPKKKLKAKEVIKDINTGMDDLSLMNKYGLSAKQLVSLYKKLEDAGLMTK
jgi:hypothetical protein